jgi:nitroreductase
MIIINKLRKIKKNYLSQKILTQDAYSYKDYYATSEESENNGKAAARDILVFSHVVEKGLSHKFLKPLFGYDRVKIISERLKQYIEYGGNDQFIISLALSTLEHYNKVNVDMKVPNEKLIIVPLSNCEERMDVGATELSASQFFSNSNGFVSNFSMSRHSLRLYDCLSDEISDEDILKSIRIAQSAPSACNRQSTRIKIVKDKQLMKKIFDIQGGAKGFGDNAGALLIVTSDISLYEPAERRLPPFDAGLFTMNLVYALHDNKIGSCILNASFTKEREIEIQKVASLPSNEMYCALIALSKIPDKETVKIAKSGKRAIKDIVSYL